MKKAKTSVFRIGGKALSMAKHQAQREERDIKTVIEHAIVEYVEKHKVEG